MNIMFYLIGTGIAFDITLSAFEALKKCNEIYVEMYTNPIEQAQLEALEKLIGKHINVLKREQVESNFLIERSAKPNSNIALLASGDPLTATTHITLVMDARKRGIDVRVIHNSSIYTAAPGKAGLQIYRFGKTATLVNPRPNYKPTSSLDVIRNNQKNNMHTLVLLDTEPKPMEAKTALEILSEFEMAVVLSRLGENDERVTYGKIEELKKRDDLGKPPFAIIIPAKLHVVEEEYLSCLGSTH